MKRILIIISSSVLSSCALLRSSSTPPPRTLSEVRPTAAFTSTIERTVDFNELQRALGNKEGTEQIRLIPVQRTTSLEDPVAPEYRLFGVSPRSIYSLLGLENADILVAADDFLIHDPRTFPMYVNLLGKQSEAKIEIRRGNRALVLANKIVNQEAKNVAGGVDETD
jgi:type II secretory pathway component PulC